MLRVRDMIVKAWTDIPSEIQRLITSEKVDRGILDGGVNTPDEFGHTPLMLACMTPAFLNMKTLIRNGARVNDVCTMKWNALMYAVYSDQPVHIELLLYLGSDIEQVTHSGRTVFHLAAMDYKTAELELLLSHATDHGIDLDLLSVMKQAMDEKQMKAVEILINHASASRDTKYIES